MQPRACCWRDAGRAASTRDAAAFRACLARRRPGDAGRPIAHGSSAAAARAHARPRWRRARRSPARPATCSIRSSAGAAARRSRRVRRPSCCASSRSPQRRGGARSSRWSCAAIRRVRRRRRGARAPRAPGAAAASRRARAPISGAPRAHALRRRRAARGRGDVFRARARHARRSLDRSASRPTGPARRDRARAPRPARSRACSRSAIGTGRARHLAVRGLVTRRRRAGGAKAHRGDASERRAGLQSTSARACARLVLAECVARPRSDAGAGRCGSRGVAGYAFSESARDGARAAARDRACSASTTARRLLAADGREYVIRLAPPTARRARRCRGSNVIANERFGFLVSETRRRLHLEPATAASTGSRRGRTIRSLDPHGEALYVRDEDARRVLVAAARARAGRRAPTRSRHGFGYTRWRHASHELEQEIDAVRAAPTIR